MVPVLMRREPGHDGLTTHVLREPGELIRKDAGIDQDRAIVLHDHSGVRLPEPALGDMDVPGDAFHGASVAEPVLCS